MPRFINVIRMYFALLKIATNPNSTASAISMADRLRDLGLLDAEERKLMSDAASAEVIKQRKMMGRIDLLKLNTLPEASLGRIYSSHMLSLGLDPEFYKNIPIVDNVTLGMMRLRQTHDLWHVMTGFDTSVPGELGLQAFMMAQTASPLAPLLIGGRLLTTVIKDPKEVPLILDSVARGWLLGKNSKPIFAIDWEKHWETPLLDLQIEYLAGFNPKLSSHLSLV